MADKRTPGPIGFESGNCGLRDGTMMLRESAVPGPLGASASVGEISLVDRFIIVLQKTAPLLPGVMQQEFRALLSPSNLLIVAGTLAAWAASHAVGIGFIVDAILLVAGGVLLGMQIFSAACELMEAIRLTSEARRESDLDQGAVHMARFITTAGVGVLSAILLKKAASARGNSSAAKISVIVPQEEAVNGLIIARRLLVNEYLERAGISPGKFNDYIRGWDLRRPVYEIVLEPGDRIISFNRNPSMYGAGETGNFFALKSAAMDNVGIDSGLSGRHAVEFEVLRRVTVLEGTAAPIGGPPAGGISGSGGATQIFIPDRGVSSLRAIGHAE